ncbi:small ribosomal subunit protein eS12-like [Zophobas morio]|uniref:small ribosomal subunit protein eS12-like n=1 Tax=Zophobas morio TaxID=2755281 RepID=UPI003082D6A4
MSEETSSATSLPTPVETQIEMTRERALREVLKQALVKGGLVRGLKETVKALDSNVKIVEFCILASDCDDKSYIQLVEALCRKNSIPLLREVDKLSLGEWCGLCKINIEGAAVKITSCSSAAVLKDAAPTIDSPSVAYEFLLSTLAS